MQAQDGCFNYTSPHKFRCLDRGVERFWLAFPPVRLPVRALLTSLSLVERGEKACGFEKSAGAGHACCLEDLARFDEIVLGFFQKRGFAK